MTASLLVGTVAAVGVLHAGARPLGSPGRDRAPAALLGAAHARRGGDRRARPRHLTLLPSFALLGAMAVVFGLATIATYVVVTGIAMRGLERVSLGPLERYGEVLSGLLVAAVGIYALVTA